MNEHAFNKFNYPFSSSLKTVNPVDFIASVEIVELVKNVEPVKNVKLFVKNVEIFENIVCPENPEFCEYRTW